MKPKQPTNNKSLSAQLLEFSGMAFEMLIIIGLFVAIGLFIDKKTAFKFPIFTVIMSLVGLSVSFYQIFKRLKNQK
jgi:F0F1-type ATP synthase assembly protein I